MTPFQKQRRAELERELGRPDPKAVELGILQLLRPFVPALPANAPLLLHSDDHPAYRRALRRLRVENLSLEKKLTLRHQVTSSTERRTTSNPLFPVNLADLLLRHSGAESAAMWVGLTDRLLGWREILRRRLFPKQAELPEPWGDYYWRRVQTLALGGRQGGHRCRYTF
jgi:hypothetical protein